ncbi:MAG: epimerase [Candidatus Andersenbacteria bacterium CG10_big_fil_rev_8_21_14_0_10_54_11]|uniref:Epimerase n=1 Tax=Candidatus Andersenbacteria bacterium CG10_big_fil_rev_8_21_14_0_10_54_11 TaxID=1974485 RepID=A0A2M6WYX6_9BACT|nr:MAG: epimerase [Candidatus Andersenbacteria bacterium CG10_big_fil_rev_8_21_14_0_10_54_11]
MAKVLITGGAGFIGAHLAFQLAKRGDIITVVDDFNNRYDPALKEARVTALLQTLDNQPTVIRADIRNAALIDQLCQKERFDSVVHLAAWAAVQTSIERPHIYSQVNLDGTVNVLEAARKTGVKNIVFASSSSVYGGRSKVPFRETDDVSRPISPYAATKAAGEILCAAWHHLYNLPITCLRFFTVYGPWGRPEMALFKFATAIYRNQPVLMRGKKTMRDFTYIDDCVAGITAALDTPMGFEIFNLGESDAVSLPRFIAAIEASLGRQARIEEVPLPPGDVPKTLADISKAQSKLGYAPATAIEDGVNKFSGWFTNWYVPVYLKINSDSDSSYS